MKATVLMLGDWVLYGETPVMVQHLYNDGFEDCVAEIDEMSSDNTMEEPESRKKEVYLKAIKPIPITPEILEKNGFRFDGSGQWRMMFISEPHFADGIRFNIYVGLKHKTIEVFAAHPVEKSPNWRKSNKVYLEVCGCYVHELQHALRLCGINDEIKL